MMKLIGGVALVVHARIRPMLSATAAGSGYGSWAAWAHHHLGLAIALRAGATQAALSVALTLFLSLVLERLFRLPDKPVRGFWLAALVTSGLSITWLIVGHTLMGTPRVLLAILPSAIVGTIFYCVYARALLRRASREISIDRTFRTTGLASPGFHSAEMV